MPKCPACGQTLDVTLIKALSAEDIENMLRAIDDISLEGNDAAFVADLKGRLTRYGDRTKVTQPQRKWLVDLAKRYPARPVKSPELEITDDDIPF